MNILLKWVFFSPQFCQVGRWRDRIFPKNIDDIYPVFLAPEPPPPQKKKKTLCTFQNLWFCFWSPPQKKNHTNSIFITWQFLRINLKMEKEKKQTSDPQWLLLTGWPSWSTEKEMPTWSFPMLPLCSLSSHSRNVLGTHVP